MTGEKLAWFRLASHLHIPVEELAERISFREFLGWMEFLKWDESRNTKADYYLAQIAAEVRRSAVKHPRKVKVKDFLLRMSDKPTQDSKSIWLSHFGINPKE